MSKHTQGQWYCHIPGPDKKDKRLLVLHPDGEHIICRLDEGWSGKEPMLMSERIANAKLIAAATAMFECLDEIRGGCCTGDQAYDMAKTCLKRNEL